MQNDYLEAEPPPQPRDVSVVIGTTNQERWPLLLGKNTGHPAAFSNLIDSFVETLQEIFSGVVGRQYDPIQREGTALRGCEIYVVVLDAE